MVPSERQKLYGEGLEVVKVFFEANSLAPISTVPVEKADWRFAACCAYYRKDQINISIGHCASIGRGGRAWSYPGYVVDRTPYGVLAHEVGHHLDLQRSQRKGSYFGDFSVSLRERTGEQPITSYAPNDAEWFAEIARLYITNPDLLRLLRPRTHKELRGLFEPVFADSWEERLSGAPERTLRAARNKIDQVRE